jgi:hypothetical protein
MNEARRDRRHLIALGLAPLLLALSAVLIASACSSNNNSSKPRPDGGPACQPGLNTCATGTVCNNSTCKPVCTDDSSCSADQYCANSTPPKVCAPKTFTACTVDQDCPLPQFCNSGLCISIEFRADGSQTGCLLTGPNDGCSPEALCYARQLQTGAVVNNCIGLPACGQDGTCPVGSLGSVCNEQADGGRLLPAKQRVCLLTVCTDNSNCPLTAACFRADAGNASGECNFGAAGYPCLTPADCFNAVTCLMPDGGVDDGGVLGTCQ